MRIVDKIKLKQSALHCSSCLHRTMHSCRLLCHNYGRQCQEGVVFNAALARTIVKAIDKQDSQPGISDTEGRAVEPTGAASAEAVADFPHLTGQEKRRWSTRGPSGTPQGLEGEGLNAEHPDPPNLLSRYVTFESLMSSSARRIGPSQGPEISPSMQAKLRTARDKSNCRLPGKSSQ